MRFRNRNNIGRTREKLAAMLEAALRETDFSRGCVSRGVSEFTVDPSDLRAAQGRYRSDWRQDSYRWEATAYAATAHSKRGFPAFFCSYDTMTNCVRYGFTLTEDPDRRGVFDVYRKTKPAEEPKP